MKINVPTFTYENPQSGQRRVLFGPITPQNDISYKPGGGVHSYTGFSAFINVLLFRASIIKDSQGNRRYVDKWDLKEMDLELF